MDLAKEHTANIVDLSEGRDDDVLHLSQSTMVSNGSTDNVNVIIRTITKNSDELPKRRKNISGAENISGRLGKSLKTLSQSR